MRHIWKRGWLKELKRTRRFAQELQVEVVVAKVLPRNRKLNWRWISVILNDVSYNYDENENSVNQQFSIVLVL